ncbi:MAG: hypothetical protein H6838_00910 [Planctomycetes bacterium]|nr:hypothetical protein [Planctomycetota bacterium]MCB9884015.1 hypothetical protein [Planctomycetota bacterium]
MLRRTYQKNLHRIALAMGLVVMLVAGFAAQRSVRHCRGMQQVAATSACCHQQTATRPAQSCCAPGTCHCAEQHAAKPTTAAGDATAVGGDDSIGAAGCDTDCCVAIDVNVPTGPLPKAFEIDGHLPAVATFAPPALHLPTIERVWLPPFATGPPRPDPRLELRRTTLLLI